MIETISAVAARLSLLALLWFVVEAWSEIRQLRKAIAQSDGKLRALRGYVNDIASAVNNLAPDEAQEALEQIAECPHPGPARDMAREALSLPYSGWPR